MENKAIFESVKSFCDFWFTMLGVAPFPKEIEKAQKEGYIRKSAVEEAEEMYSKWIQTEKYDGSIIAIIHKQHEAIQELKSEIARLKK